METTSLAALIRLQGTQRASHPYLHFEGQSLTYADLDQTSSALASVLAAEGVGPGDRVAILEKNTPLCFDVMFGAAKCGAASVPINWRLAPTEVTAIVVDADAKVLIVGEEFDAPVIDGVHVVRAPDVATWCATGDGVDPGYEQRSDDVAIQLYTSGTTGVPKGVVLTNCNLLGRLGDAGKLWGYDPDSVNLVVSPLFHIGGAGTALLAFIPGATSVMLRTADPVQILSAIGTYSVTNAFLVPALIQMLLDSPGCEDVDWSTFRTLLYGASPISTSLLRRAMSVMRCDFIQLYGITEHSGCLTYLPPGDHDPEQRPALLRSCGKPLPWVDLKVVDPDDLTPLGPHQVGEIWVRSDQTMLGYWKQPNATATALTSEGWLRTGDAGFRDDQGYLILHDRIKDMIISGGENIYPAEVENVLSAHPAVADCAVIGAPHDLWGETPLAVIVLRAGTRASPDLDTDIIAFCRRSLAGFKCPTRIKVVDVLPRNPAGKVLKRELREAAWAGHPRRVG